MSQNAKEDQVGKSKSNKAHCNGLYREEPKTAGKGLWTWKVRKHRRRSKVKKTRCTEQESKSFSGLS